jgi:hypothetical protein
MSDQKPQIKHTQGAKKVVIGLSAKIK